MTFAHRFDPGVAEEARLALVLHGTGGDEHSLVPFAQALLPGAAILSPRGRILERGMNRFFRRFAEGVFDEDNIREEADALAAFVQEAKVHYGVAEAPVTVIGYSNGANMGWSTLLRYPKIAQELVLFRAMPTLTDETPNLSHVRAFVSEGINDPIVSEAQANALVLQMERLGVRTTLHWHPGGHELARPELEAAMGWLGLA